MMSEGQDHQKGQNMISALFSETDYFEKFSGMKSSFVSEHIFSVIHWFSGNSCITSGPRVRRPHIVWRHRWQEDADQFVCGRAKITAVSVVTLLLL